MPHGYCTECQAQVTVRDGLCLLDHPVDPDTIEHTPGRRLRGDARRRRGTHSRPRTVDAVTIDPPPLGGGLAVIERELDRPEPTRFIPVPATHARQERVVDDPPRRTERDFSPVTDSDTLSLTGLLVEELWNLSPDEDIEGWVPGELDATLVQSGIRKRKIVAITAVAVVALLVGWRTLTWDATRTTEATQAVGAASVALAEEVSNLRGPVADLADGSVDDPLAASSAIARLDDTARSLFGLAGELPTDPEIAPVREGAIGQAGSALDLATVLSESVAYSAAVDLITRPLELPASTDVDGLATLTETVTAWVNDFTGGVESLPSNELTDTHRSALAGLAASLGDWQASYLDALRGRDETRAAEHVTELATQIAFVRESWNEAAASIAEWADERIAELSVPLVANR